MWREIRHVWPLVFPWGFLDSIGHRLHLPRVIQARVCRRLERALWGPGTPPPKTRIIGATPIATSNPSGAARLEREEP